MIEARLLFAFAAAALLVGCGTGSDCTLDSDCPARHFCSSNGVCLPGTTARPDTGGGTADTPAPIGSCPAAAPGELVLNEILADPTDLDANFDGTVGDSRTDEFVEFVSTTDREIALAGLSIRVNGDTFHEFDVTAGCLAPGRAVVVYGKGAGLPPTADVGGALAVSASGGKQLTNGGATLELAGATGVLDTHTWGAEGGRDQSLARAPDYVGDWFPHSDVAADGAKMSPGRCTGGALFPACEGGTPPIDAGPGADPGAADPGSADPGSADPGAADPGATDDGSGADAAANPCDAPQSGELIINEILANPDGKVDADGDGEFDNRKDEFVEIVNTAGHAVDLAGLTITANDQSLIALEAAHGCLDHRAALLVFGKGSVPAPGAFGSAVVVAATGNGQFSNSGTTVRLRRGETLLAEQATGSPPSGQSLTRSPDGTGSFAPHTTVTAERRASPGSCVDGRPFTECLLP